MSGTKVWKVKGFPYHEDIYNHFWELEPNADKYRNLDMSSKYYFVQFPYAEDSAKRKGQRRMYKEFIDRVCKAYNLKVPTNKEENKQFHKELDNIEQQRKQKQIEERKMKEEKTNAMAVMVENSSVVKDMQVTKMDIVQLIKTKLLEKNSNERKQLENKREELKVRLRENEKKISEICNKLFEREIEKTKKEVSKVFKKLYGNTDIEVVRHGMTKSFYDINHTLEKIRIMVSIGSKSFNSLVDKSHCRFADYKTYTDVNSPPIVTMQNIYTIPLPKEVKQLQKENMEFQSNGNQIYDEINKVIEKAHKIESDVQKYHVKITEEILESSVDGKKLLEKVNKIISEVQG